PKSAKENTAPSSQPTEASSDEPPAPQKPLPDLRHGIPSTFAEEFLQKQGRKQPTEAERDTAKIDEEIAEAREQQREREEAEAAAGGRGGGDLPKSAYETSTDRRRNKVMNWVYVGFALLGITGSVFLGQNWETDEEAKNHPNAPSGWGFALFWERIKARINDSMGYYTEPTFPKLLPVMDPPAPYTLVLSLEDLMIHSEWSRQHGYRTAKRPGLDYFLRYLSQYYEIVLFTSLPMGQAEPVYRKLDPYHIIMWPLFREATRYHKGEYIKDLSYLNRDLSKVIILDTNAKHVSAQPENAIVLPPWKGDPKDRDLVSYVPFLEHIAAMGVPDVRKALASFEGKHIPTEYALREAHAREEFQKQLAEERSKRPRHSLGAVLGKSLGLKPTPAPGSMIVGDDGTTAAEGFAKGMMLSDQIRERGRKQYEQLEMQIRQEGEKWLKEMEDEEKKMQEQFSKDMKGSMWGFFGGKDGPPPAQGQSSEGQEKR
ncbi:NIF-domain-containing protein, partial [Rhizodiscina lignyota]